MAGKKIPRNCEQCLKPFNAPVRHVKRGFGRFCSRSCANTGGAIPAERRFWPKVLRGSEDECWPWQAHRDKDGYGRFGRSGRTGAHQSAYIFTYGARPHGKWVLHSCDNPPCCNPKHLRLGTGRDNASDREQRGRGADNGGEKHYAAKLTNAQAEEIRTRYNRRKGVTQYVLAAEYGVSQSAIGLILLHKTYKHSA